jgi:membrane fusion protein (multidrug efflux system)
MDLIRALPLLAALALPLSGCSEDSRADDGAGPKAASDKAADPAKQDEAVPVEVAALGLGEIEAVLRFSTNLEAENAVEVFSQASRQVRELLVEEGHRVGKGQLLARLQDEEQRTALAKVESQLAKARREYERQKRLFAQEMISEQAFNDATYELEQLELALEEASRQLSYTEVRAPIAGTVTQRLINLGDHVTVNQHLFDLVDFGSIVARVFVPEKELARLADGQLARIASPALPDARFEGRVERLAPIVDPKSGTVKVTVAIPETAGLRPGMYVDVELVTDVRQDALLLPKRALVYDRDQIFVYRLGAERKVERVLVKPLLADKDFILPTAGLAPGDLVVIAGQAGLKDGARVRLPGEGA